jgi:hypothetical protein
MNRTRSCSDPARASAPPVVSHMSAADVNQLAIRIHSLKSIPPGTRLTAFFDCVRDLKNVAPVFVQLLVGELQTARNTLPSRQAGLASEALEKAGWSTRI